MIFHRILKRMANFSGFCFLAYDINHGRVSLIEFGPDIIILPKNRQESWHYIWKNR